jgi:hypothetical protein
MRWEAQIIPFQMDDLLASLRTKAQDVLPQVVASAKTVAYDLLALLLQKLAGAPYVWRFGYAIVGGMLLAWLIWYLLTSALRSLWEGKGPLWDMSAILGRCMCGLAGWILGWMAQLARAVLFALLVLACVNFMFLQLDEAVLDWLISIVPR